VVGSLREALVPPPFRHRHGQRGALQAADDATVTVERRKGVDYRRGSDSRRIEQAVSELASFQRGVVSRHQLLALGLSPQQVQRRLAAGRLARLHHGVYAVGHRALAFGAPQQAALLAAGSDAALAHRSAAAWLGMLGRWDGRIHVVVPTQDGRRIPGVAVHRCASLRAQDVVVHDGLRCTTPARTLVDLAASAPQGLPRALTEAQRLHLDVGPALELLAREPGRRGAQRLARALADFDPRTAATRSVLEVRFLAAMRAAGLPAPQVNVVVDAGPLRPEADFLWPAERLAVEVDGRAFHDLVATAEADRRRDNALALAGFLVLRFTWRRLDADPRGVVAEVAAALRRRARTPPRDRTPASPR